MNFFWPTKFNVHETCIPSPSTKLTSFPFIKTLHEPYSSALKKENTVFTNFPSFQVVGVPLVHFLSLQTAYLSTKFPGSLSVDKISPVFGVQMLLYS